VKGRRGSRKLEPANKTATKWPKLDEYWSMREREVEPIQGYK